MVKITAVYETHLAATSGAVSGREFYTPISPFCLYSLMQYIRLHWKRMFLYRLDLPLIRGRHGRHRTVRT